MCPCILEDLWPGHRVALGYAQAWMGCLDDGRGGDAQRQPSLCWGLFATVYCWGQSILTEPEALCLNPRSALGCVSEDNSLSFSEPQFIHLGNGNEIPTSQGIWEY